MIAKHSKVLSYDGFPKSSHASVGSTGAAEPREAPNLGKQKPFTAARRQLIMASAASRLILSLLFASSAARDEQSLRGSVSSDLAIRSGGRHTSFAPYQMGEPPGSSGTDVVGVLRQAEAELFLQCDHDRCRWVDDSDQVLKKRFPSAPAVDSPQATTFQQRKKDNADNGYFKFVDVGEDSDYKDYCLKYEDSGKAMLSKSNCGNDNTKAYPPPRTSAHLGSPSRDPT